MDQPEGIVNVAPAGVALGLSAAARSAAVAMGAAFDTAGG
jgi:hypothetical protein